MSHQEKAARSLSWSHVWAVPGHPGGPVATSAARVGQVARQGPGAMSRGMPVAGPPGSKRSRSHNNAIRIIKILT